MAVTGCDGWAEVEFPFGMVVASVGRSAQEDWVGVDKMVEFCFPVRSREVERLPV